MATYIVGDIQGCYDELMQLLSLANFDPKNDELWVAGDLVARGPKSLQTLRYLKKLKAKVILGNHDLHLLATSLGIHKAKEKDKISPILEAEDSQQLLTWLRKQPLLLEHPEHKFIMVHAGILPSWTIPQAKQFAKEVEQQLHGEDYQSLLKNMYGNHPTKWQASLSGIERIRYIINVFTRMRYCTLDGELEFYNKLSPAETDSSVLKPWFEITPRDHNQPILFGHWAALLGQTNQQNLYALDTGCVWGNRLTMIRWQDKKLFSLSCPAYG
ncbi:symmetrical bis(5'-nucleosyl)-tetraphosphatase [Psychromonas sp. SA13A]|uniref:symmetrical bis(5'-nucleosyl)-tetraphosphatase n=1 Tax=Psychromonas sp. SA13A TaxID=2686346 RepID=UPI001409BD89|nr:symmetrical bis(5'-nucleosyl)-tetraphosphatase [Psychromonas sp. SA13A]